MLLKKPHLIIGNGESRQSLNLNKLKNNFITFGCNALCRDFEVDHLVCVDRRMVKEALAFKVKNIYTRQDWKKHFPGPDVQTVPELPYQGDQRWDQPFHWGSGPYALLLSACMEPQEVHMIGFDLQSTTSTVNNIYKGTENYVDKNHRPVDPRYWLKQNAKVFELFPKIQFTIYNTEDWELPTEWKFNNVTKKTISDLTSN